MRVHVRTLERVCACLCLSVSVLLHNRWELGVSASTILLVIVIGWVCLVCVRAIGRACAHVLTHGMSLCVVG